MKIIVLLIALFPGVFKMVIHFSSPVVNMGSFILFVIFGFIGINSRQLTINDKYYIKFLIFVIILISIYPLFSFEQLDNKSLEYLIKAYFYLFMAIFLLYSFKYTDILKFNKYIIYYSLLITILYLLNLIDYKGTSTNYLIYSLVLGIAIILLWNDVLFGKISFVAKLFYIILSIYFLVMNLMAGSRGTFIFTLFIVFIMIIYRLKKNKLHYNLVYIFFLFSFVYIATIKILEYVNINSWFAYKMTRLFGGDVTEEPRYELYSNVFEYIKEHANLFGFGFHASRNVSTSWDPALPYLESFPLEITFNYGIFGIIILMFIFYFIFYFIKINKFKYINTSKSFFVFLYIFLNFSKSWSVYNGFVIFPLISMVLIVYDQEKKGIVCQK